MLVELSVRNFRSIRERQTLSMVATSLDDHEHTHVFASGSAGADRLLRTAVIYGANAAGKSNLLTAFHAMREIVRLSSRESQSGEPIPVDPFALDESSDEPCEFEIVIVQDAVKYQYGFAATRERITEEWLFAFPGGKGPAQKWFERTYLPKSSDYGWRFSSHLKGPKVAWRTATRPNALFLSTAVQLNATQLTPVYAWFQNKLRYVLGTGNLTANYSKGLLEDPDKRKRIAAFMRNADMGIEDIELENPSLAADLEKYENASLPGPMRNHSGRQTGTVNVRHSRSNGKAIWFDLEEESQGTQKLFAYAGPFLDVIENGRVLVVDELNNSLHPLILQRLLETFNDPEFNRSNAQLIFASHGTSILNLELLRRDEIWFAEKTPQHATVLYSLKEFSPRKDSSLRRGYLQGRYGAIPFLSQSLIDG